MDLLKLVCLLSSGFVQFIIVAIIIGCFLPDCLLGVYGFIMALIIIGGLLFMFVSLFGSLK